MQRSTIAPAVQRNADAGYPIAGTVHGRTTSRVCPRRGVEGLAPLDADLSTDLDERYRIAAAVARATPAWDPLAAAAARAGLTRRDYIAAVHAINARFGR